MSGNPAFFNTGEKFHKNTEEKADQSKLGNTSSTQGKRVLNQNSFSNTSPEFLEHTGDEKKRGRSRIKREVWSFFFNSLVTM
jgi:hypothetical protein